MNKFLLLGVAILFCSSALAAEKCSIEGVVKDTTNGESIPYAHIFIEGTNTITLSDSNGYYTLSIPSGKHTLNISFSSYITQSIEVDVEDRTAVQLDIALEADDKLLKTVSIVWQKNTNAESGVIEQIKKAQTVVSGVSNEQIAKSQDKDATEVVKRIPYATIIDDRFIIIRGLSLRYNDAWINSGIAPSSETDSRAFSFDFIPSATVKDILVYKNFSADMGADFAGGFVKVNTLETPVKNGFQIGYGIGFRTNLYFGPMILMLIRERILSVQETLHVICLRISQHILIILIWHNLVIMPSNFPIIGTYINKWLSPTNRCRFLLAISRRRIN